LAGKAWNRAVAQEASEVLINEATPISDHRASAAYRSAMLGASLRKFFSENTAISSSHQEAGAS
jgi:xanthine dehydrogenase small subunit